MELATYVLGHKSVYVLHMITTSHGDYLSKHHKLTFCIGDAVCLL
jgi:hypothetical protein